MTNVTHESPSVQSYLGILQAVISRMAANSSACKTWCITLVSAIVVIIADKGKPQYISISIIPIVLFLVLDSYYLGLERLFRDLYNSFIKKLHDNAATVNDVFIVTPGSKKDIVWALLDSLFSVSVLPFYLLLGFTLYIVGRIIK